MDGLFASLPFTFWVFQSLRKHLDSVRDYRQYLSSHPPPLDSAAVQKELDDRIEEKKKETKAAAAASAEYPQQYHRHNNFYTNPNGNPIPNTNPSSNQYYPKPDKPGAGSGSSKQWKNGGSMDEDDDPYKFSGYKVPTIVT